VLVNQAIGEYSHAEGEGTTAQGAYSHAEGNSTTTIGEYSHAEGASTLAQGATHTQKVILQQHQDTHHTQKDKKHKQLDTLPHTEGLDTVASGSYQHVQGQFNLSSSAQSAFIVGNGTSDASRSNLVFASGSQFQVTGSVIATTGFTGSLQGTASFAVTASHVISASFAVTASHVISASYAVTASHVDLLAGPNITINKVGTTFEISGSGGGGGITPAETGSFYVSSSINSYTIEFNQGDGTTESVNITPFTYSLVTTQNYTFPLHPDNSGGSVFKTPN
jgi:trimeric autotransporter adhesin